MHNFIHVLSACFSIELSDMKQTLDIATFSSLFFTVRLCCTELCWTRTLTDVQNIQLRFDLFLDQRSGINTRPCVRDKWVSW